MLGATTSTVAPLPGSWPVVRQVLADKGAVSRRERFALPQLLLYPFHVALLMRWYSGRHLDMNLTSSVVGSAVLRNAR